MSNTVNLIDEQRLANYHDALMKTHVLNGTVFDISEYNASNGTPATYANLAAALGTNGANVPVGVRRGGMSVKFIQGTAQSSDNKYVQARCMAQNFTTDVTQWQGVDDEPTAGSDNLVKSGGVAISLNDIRNSETGYKFDVGFAYDTVSTSSLPAKTETASYNSMLITPPQGTVVNIKGVGGSNRRLWAIYSKYGFRTRMSDSSADTRENGINLTLVNDEKYIIINTIASYSSQTCVVEKNIPNVLDKFCADFTLQNGLTKRASIWGSLSMKLEEGYRYTSNSYVVGTTLLPVKSTGDYVCLMLSLNVGDSIKIHGLGGTAARLWSVYDENQVLTRVSDTDVDATIDGVSLTLAEGEKYIVYNCQNSAKDYASISVNGLPDICIANRDTLAQLMADFNIGYKSKVSLIDTATEESGKFLVYDGSLTKVTTSASNKIDVFNVSGYDAVRFNASTKWGGSGTTTTNKVAYAVTDGAGTVLARGSYGDYQVDKSYYVKLPKNAVTLYISHDSSLSIDNFVEAYILNSYTEDLTDKVIWGDSGEFLRYNNYSIIRNATSAANRIGIVDVSGYTRLAFNTSLVGGGSSIDAKILYAFADKNGNVLGTSLFYSNSESEQKFFVLEVPDGAVSLYVSWDGSSERNIFGYIEAVPRIQKEFDLETGNVSSYMKVQYNNNDYSYTEESGYNFDNTSQYDKPNCVTVNTPLVADSNTQRTLLIADNINFRNAKSITLDSTSKELVISNLICDKEYRYLVVTDNQVLYGGSFKTKGRVRFLLLDTINGYTYSYIRNARDIGGKKTIDGKTIRYGVIARGYELNHKEDSNIVTDISPSGIATLIANGFNSELDFRSGYDAGVLEYYASMPIEMELFAINIYRSQSGVVQRLTPVFRKILDWIKSGHGIYMHCQGGCDRTGVVAFLLEGLCGVTENDINKDYELSARDRSREYCSLYRGDNLDGDFKYAIEFIKNLKNYDGHIYTRCQSYKNSNITIGSTVYQRNGTEISNDVKYCKWTNGSTSYYTTDIYPTSESIIYDSSFNTTELVLNSSQFVFYYDAEAIVSSYTPVPITDSAIIDALDNIPRQDLKQCFRTFMHIGAYGLSDTEMDELETILTC